MSRMTIYGSKKDRKAVLEFLQRRNVIDISAPDASNAEYGFSETNTNEAQTEFIKDSGLGARALEILSDYSPEKGGLLSSLEGRKELTVTEYYEYVDDIPEMLRVSARITELSDEIAEREGRIVRCRSEIEELAPWRELDTELAFGGTRSTAAFAGVFGEELTREALISLYNEREAPPAEIEAVSTEARQTCVFVICSRAELGECEKRMREIGMSHPKTAYRGIPREEIAERERMIAALEKEISSLKNEIRSYSGARNAIKFMADYYAMRADKYRVLSNLSQSKSTFVIEGYVPTDEAAQLAAVLEHKYNAAAEISEADDDAPVQFKNPYLTEPVEGVVRTFAMPTKEEIDPTSIMAVFYYVLFGMMLSDAAYGFIISLGCGLALKKIKSMEDSMKKTLRMFMYCGISTMFWGIMFGSFFGDAVAVVSRTFFGTEVTIPPLWFEPVKEPMRLLMFSFLLGLIHLFTALGIKMYQCIKAKDYWSVWSDCVFWYMLIGGGVVYLFHVDMFLSMAGIEGKLPDLWANVAAIIAGIGALGIVLFTARGGGVGKRLAKGAYALYGATSWLSDILSYSRLLALGLATGVIATVFNKMGSMFGGGVIGAVIFAIVFVIGHTLNIGINLLGAYVHTNRLQFVEFFGKFYEGGGREYLPFGAKTKYYKFREE
ncbi:MAG: V-type ATP synthase subunit I [Clostridia bacterium]|nr:V-type ATP synthase subunit I [Clostridia bacterium]